MALAVNTPDHLRGLGLLPDSNSSSVETVVVRGREVSRDDLGYLFHVALDKLTFLPFAYVMDQWRWSLFTGEVPDQDINSYWWSLREQLQGIRSPVNTSEQDFHPGQDCLTMTSKFHALACKVLIKKFNILGAKYHIPANVPYIRYFVSYVVQFQMYEALCLESGQYDPQDPSKPLYLCDFSLGAAETGQLIREMMSAGFSQPWQQALQQLTGDPHMSAASFIRYFLPLYDYLEQENQENGVCVGWGDDC